MRTWTLERSVLVRRPLRVVFEFFADAGNLQALTPPWVNFAILTPRPIAMGRGVTIDYRVRIRGVPIRWRSVISEWEPPERFVDEQVRGPYRRWVHEHRFEAVDAGTLVHDRVRYAVPGGPLAPILHRLLVRADLERIFNYRTHRLADL